MFKHLFSKKKSAEDLMNITFDNHLTLVKNLLVELNCVPQGEKKGNSYFFTFTFQTGFFQLQVVPGSPFVELAYVHIDSVPFRYINEVRTVCNDINLSTDGERITYSLDYEKNEAILHLFHSLSLDSKNGVGILTLALRQAFYWQRILNNKLEEAIKKAKESDVVDKERITHDEARELFLLRELEISTQDTSRNWHENKNSAITIQHWVDSILGTSNIEPIRLSIIGQDNTELTDKDEILNYSFSKAFLNENLVPTSKVATLDLCFKEAKTPDIERHIAFYLTEEGVTTEAIYYRITSTLIPLPLSKISGKNDITHKENCLSILVAYDLRTDKQLHDEFLYFWKEAKSKMEGGKQNELTEEESMLAQVSNPDLGFYLYRGKQLLLNKRYAEAVLSLENGYKMLSIGFNQPNENNRELMNEVAYHIGLCYLELRQYERAYFYLDTTIPRRNLKHLVAYVNCLIALHDSRALQYVNMFIHEIEEQTKEEDEEPTLPEGLKQFYLFLLRRKVFILRDIHEWDEALRILGYLKENDLEHLDLIDKQASEIAKEKSKFHLPKDGNNDKPQNNG